MSTAPFGQDHEQLRIDLGAYVLGGLTAEETRVLEAHLAACAACRAELASIETLPALLDAVPGARAEEIAHDAARPPELATAPRELLARVTRRRRARTAGWAGALAAAAAGFFATGIALGPALGAGHGPTAQGSPSPSVSAPAPTPAQTLTLTSADGAHVDLSLVHKAWGTELDLTCRGMPSDSVFTVWVVGADGAAQQAASWSSGGYGAKAVLTGATSLQLASIRAIEIRNAAQQTVARTSVG